MALSIVAWLAYFFVRVSDSVDPSLAAATPFDALDARRAKSRARSAMIEEQRASEVALLRGRAARRVAVAAPPNGGGAIARSVHAPLVASFYPEKDCGGVPITVALAEAPKEHLCTTCRDFCGKKFASGVDGMKTKSLRVSGATARSNAAAGSAGRYTLHAVSLWRNCLGTYKYADGGFLSFVIPDDGCVPVAETFTVAHAKLHVVALDRPATAGAKEDTSRRSDSSAGAAAAAPFAALPGGSARDHDYGAVLAALLYMDAPAATAATARAERSAQAGKYVTFCPPCPSLFMTRYTFSAARILLTI